MRFLWPDLLWLLLAVPALVAAYCLRAVAQEGGRSLRQPAARQGRDRPRPAVPAPRAAARLPARDGGRARRARAAERGIHPAVAAADDRPRDGRLAQHAREGRGAQPHHARRRRRRSNSSSRCRTTCASASSRSPERPRSSRRRRENRDDLIAAIDRFQLQRATATGSGLILSLSLLLPDAGIDLESVVFDRNFSRFGGGTRRRRPHAPAGEGGEEGLHARRARLVQDRARSSS